ncbi:MAG: DUF47 family protein [Clostridium sp.]|nr:DUF47 family protein [Clostridium sp.]
MDYKIENKINTENKVNESFIEKIKNIFKKNKVDYFEMFVTGAAISLEAAKTLKTALSDEIIDKKSLSYIKELEHKGDKHMHKSLEIIEIAFITPIDQNDLMEILESIENITDSIDDIANDIGILGIDKRDNFMVEFIDIIVFACEKIYNLMIAFKKYKENSSIISELTIQINLLESEGDKIYWDSMHNLFKVETNPINILKKKEIYKRLEDTLDCCEDVADLVERIMVRES